MNVDPLFVLFALFFITLATQFLASLFITLIEKIAELATVNLEVLKRKFAQKSDSLYGSIMEIPVTYLFLNAKNREEIIGDLLEQDEYMKVLGYSDSKRIKNMLIQIFVINIALIKTKIENAFSMNKKINE